jgi:hypothetical protein
LIGSNTTIDPAILDETQCYVCKSILTKPQTFILVESEQHLRLDTDDCGGICFGCLKEKEKEMYGKRIIL